MPITNFGVLSVLDYSAETGTTLFNVPDDVAFGGIVTAVEDVIYNDTLKQTQYSTKDLLRAFPTTNVEAQREQKLQVKFIDDVTFKKHELTIGCFDKSTVTFVQNSDLIQFDINAVLPSGNAADTLAQALEANLISEAGNPVTITEMRFVGRNS